MPSFLLKPRWIALHLVVAAATAGMVWLGFWQLQRLEDRREFNSVVVARADAAPLDLSADTLADLTDDPETGQWTTVRASGRYAVDEAIVVVNRSSGGVAGVNVVVPLVLSDGAVILVNRGFVPLSVDPPVAPTGGIEVVGHLRKSESRRIGGAVDATGADVTEFQRFDVATITTSFGDDDFDPANVASMYLQAAVEVPNPAQRWPAPVPLPVIDEGPHLSYAVQWFVFSTFVLAGWVVVVRRGVTSRRRTSPPPGTSSA